MKPQKANTNRTTKRRAQYIYPGCGIEFFVDRIGGAYGLHPKYFCEGD